MIDGVSSKRYFPIMAGLRAGASRRTAPGLWWAHPGGSMKGRGDRAAPAATTPQRRGGAGTRRARHDTCTPNSRAEHGLALMGQGATIRAEFPPRLVPLSKSD